MVNSKGSELYRDFISKVLSFSYHTSVFIMLVGLILYLVGNPFYVRVMHLGLLVLLCTPLFRVAAAAIIFFFIEKDRRYGVISMTVLLILIASIVIGRLV